MSRPVLVSWGIGAILAAMALGASLTAAGPDLPSRIDVAWNQLMIGIRAPVILAVADMFDDVGGGWIATILIPVLCVVGLLIARRWRAAVFTVVALLVSVAVVQMLKSLFGRARPEDMLVESDFGSFPSGHTANAATLAVIAALLFRRLWVLSAGIVWTLAMAFSRTSLSVHWLSDTIGGMLVGAGAVLIVGALLLPWVRPEPEFQKEPQ